MRTEADFDSWLQDYPYSSLVDHVCNELFEYAPGIHAVSGGFDSVYIVFANLPNGLSHKLRISDHDERERYGYKWQLRIDGVENIGTRKKWSRYYDDPDKLINAFRQYYENVAVCPENQKPKQYERGKFE